MRCRGMWITCNLLWITYLSTPAAKLSTGPVDTVDNPIAYHNFRFHTIRVSTSDFLFVSWRNCFHGMSVKHIEIVANGPTFDGVIFNCHN